MTDIGTGSYTIIAQTAAEMLGVPIERVVVTGIHSANDYVRLASWLQSTSVVRGLRPLRATPDSLERWSFADRRADTLVEALAAYAADVELARETGAAARRAALRRYSLERFLTDWTDLLHEVRR